jgi:SSS family transporter
MMDLPDLPTTCAFGSGAVLGSKFYIAAGQEAPDSKEGLDNFWQLDLENTDRGWRELEPWPGPKRILPVAASQSDAIYLFSGAQLIADESGEVKRRYLVDGYRFTEEAGWEGVASVPKPVVAAPSLSYGQSHIFVFSGDDGELTEKIWELKENHPGFGKQVFAYHTLTDTWTEMGSIPVSFVATQAVKWQDRIVIPGGEDRPGHRGSRVLSGSVAPTRKSFGAIDYAMVAIYFALLVVMGVYFSKREETTEDFFLAGKRIPWWAAGLSIFGTQLSAITFLAIPAKSFADDWIYFLVNMTIIAVAPFVVFFYLPFFRRLHVTTAYEYLEKRFNLGARLFGSTTFILFQLGRMGIVTFLPALALSAATGINIYFCILATGLLSTFYTVLGGMEAVVWTDVLQSIILLGGAILSLVLIFMKIDGGVVGFVSQAWDADKLHMLDWGWDVTLPVVWVVVVGQFCANAVPYTSDQTVIQRYLTTATERQARNAIWTNAFLTFPATLIFCSVGTGLYAFYKSHPESLDPTLQTDAIFPLFIVQELPVGVAGVVLAGVFAASMSSLDSSMNSLATVTVTDFYRRLKRKPVDERVTLNLARVLTVLFGLFGTSSAIMMATFEIRSLMDFYIKMLGFLGGSLAGLFALGIFSRRATGAGALVGAVTGAVTVSLIQAYPPAQAAINGAVGWPIAPFHFFLNATLGVGVCMSVGYLLSFFIGKHPESLEGLTLSTLSKEEA